MLQSVGFQRVRHDWATEHQCPTPSPHHLLGLLLAGRFLQGPWLQSQGGDSHQGFPGNTPHAGVQMWGEGLDAVRLRTRALVWGFRQCHRQPASSQSISYLPEVTWARHLPPGSSACCCSLQHLSRERKGLWSMEGFTSLSRINVGAAKEKGFMVLQRGTWAL